MASVRTSSRTVKTSETVTKRRKRNAKWDIAEVRKTRTRTVRTVETVRRAAARPRGVILYRGPSLLDGLPIVVVATFRTENAKTGSAVQTWILADSEDNPVEAVRSGTDASVCGACPHRGKTCYVNVTQAPLTVWRAVRRGVYPDYVPSEHRALFAGRFVRLGSYGDPAAVPLEVWESILDGAAGHSGYTHQWRTCDPRLARLCMASCDTPGERAEATASGWRTFRVRTEAQPVLPGEFVCPASDEGGKRRTCAECGACSGAKAGTNASPTIVFHGPAIAGNHRLRTFERTQGRLEAQEAGRRVSLPLAL